MGNLSVCVERLADCLEEMKPFFPVHHAELGLFKDRMPLDPQYDVYLRREDAGEVIAVCLREDGAMAGYFVGFVTPGLHYRQTLSCTMDICYIREDLRNGGAGRMLFSAVKAALTARGVKCWYVGSKDHKPIEEFYRAFGFTPADHYFAMWLDGD